MTTEPEFLSASDVQPGRPDGWPLYPTLPFHRSEAEVGVLIAAPGFDPCTLVLVNIFDPQLDRILAWDATVEVNFIAFGDHAALAADGWSMGAVPGYGLEHWRDWDRRTEPCPDCGGRGYKGLASLAVPCRECEASGTRVIR